MLTPGAPSSVMLTEVLPITELTSVTSGKPPSWPARLWRSRGPESAVTSSCSIS